MRPTNPRTTTEKLRALNSQSAPPANVSPNHQRMQCRSASNAPPTRFKQRPPTGSPDAPRNRCAHKANLQAPTRLLPLGCVRTAMQIPTRSLHPTDQRPAKRKQYAAKGSRSRRIRRRPPDVAMRAAQRNGSPMPTTVCLHATMQPSVPTHNLNSNRCRQLLTGSVGHTACATTTRSSNGRRQPQARTGSAQPFRRANQGSTCQAPRTPPLI